jgi:hypothetical protein
VTKVVRVFVRFRAASALQRKQKHLPDSKYVITKRAKTGKGQRYPYIMQVF